MTLVLIMILVLHNKIPENFEMAKSANLDTVKMKNGECYVNSSCVLKRKSYLPSIFPSNRRVEEL